MITYTLPLGSSDKPKTYAEKGEEKNRNKGDYPPQQMIRKRKRKMHDYRVVVPYYAMSTKLSIQD
jgi:hypothetical protein